jgi:hypothetical protein
MNSLVDINRRIEHEITGLRNDIKTGHGAPVPHFGNRY